MSGSKRYKDDFDKYAGTPADFDSLFVFENDRLTMKKRIRKRPVRRHIAAAAAVMIAAGAALTAVGMGGMQGPVEMSDGDTITQAGGVTIAGSMEVTAALPDTETVLLSSAADITDGLFDYNIAAGIGTAYHEDGSPLELSNAVIHCGVTNKSFDSSSDHMLYEVCVYEFYSRAESTPLLSDNAVNTILAELRFEVSSDFDPADELQVGSEYYVPVIYDPGGEGGGESLTITGRGKCIRKVGSGNDIKWEMDAAAYEQLLRTSMEISEEWGCSYLKGSSETAYVNDSVFEKALLQSMGESDMYYQSWLMQSSLADNNLSSISVGLSEIFDSTGEGSGFEKVSYYTDENGNEDSTLLVLEHENYFVLAPETEGVVDYCGENVNGGLMIRITDINDDRVNSVVFSGLGAIGCEKGDRVEGQVLASCSSEPVYCRIIGWNGKPVNIDLADTAVVEAVIEETEAVQQ